MGVTLLILAGVLYFLPTIIAAARKHSNGGSICIVNAFFGWSLIGWVVPLAWACSSHTNPNAPPIGKDSIAVLSILAIILAFIVIRFWKYL